MKAVIIAAGMGSRIWNQTDNRPKTLLPYGEGTILSTILNNFNQVGISSFVIVLGYQSGYIRSYLKKNRFFGCDIKMVENLKWEKGNGISVLVTEPEVDGDNFLLSMSDHIVSISALRRITKYENSNNLLLVDPKIEDIYDIDDATKVAYQGSNIIDIGKEITQYNGVDCGIFRLNNRFFEAMNEALYKNQDSISAAIRILIRNKIMEAVFLKQDEKWLDVDTPETYRYLLENMSF